MLMECLGLACIDAEAFAKHAKRHSITLEDMKLLLRRSPQLRDKLVGMVEKQGLLKHKASSAAMNKKKIEAADNLDLDE